MGTSITLQVLFFAAGAAAFAQTPGTFTATSNMTAPRGSHTATLLPDDRILITGGYAGYPLATTEIYDPVTQTFTAAAVMTAARTGHTATLLPDGRVLIVGGDLSMGSAEIYDPSTKELHRDREPFDAAERIQRDASREWKSIDHRRRELRIFRC